MKRKILQIFLHAVFGLQQDFHVLVIDDGSPDGTAQIVKDLQPKYPGQLFLEERKGKLVWVLPIFMVLNGHWKRI